MTFPKTHAYMAALYKLAELSVDLSLESDEVIKELARAMHELRPTNPYGEEAFEALEAMFKEKT